MFAGYAADVLANEKLTLEDPRDKNKQAKTLTIYTFTMNKKSTPYAHKHTVFYSYNLIIDLFHSFTHVFLNIQAI